MDPVLRATLIKVFLPTATIVVMLAVAKRRGVSLRDDLGFRAPTRSAALGWMAVWIGWIVAGELLIRAFKLDQARPWPDSKDAPKSRWCGRTATLSIVVLLGLLVGGVFVFDAWRDSGEILSGLKEGAGWAAFVIASTVATIFGVSERRCGDCRVGGLFRGSRRETGVRP